MTGSGNLLARNQDIGLAVCVMLVLVVLILPLPPQILDILLAVNISISVVILLTTIYLQHAVDFQIFPSLLLMLTLFRLSLNVASTRLILADAYAGSVIEAFGTFVTRGNPVVGAVIFVILVVIQFVVITKGATRVSEVAARFTLDAMPGKQMGVDADLNAGLITEDQARSRRERISQEADFYGAMDGATKFVRGDAIAGVIITVVNIAGGFIIGITINSLTPGEAVSTYTRLTIGDGLVSQIPSLVIATAAGLIVTRTASDENLGADLGAQFSRYPRALGTAAVLLALFGLARGMPTVPFLVIAALLGAAAWRASLLTTRRTVEEHEQAMAVAEAEAEVEPERAEDLLRVDPLKIELGYGLIALADPRQGGDLLTRIQVIRQQMATRMGFVVPVVRIVDNMRLKPNEYRVKLREAEVARYELMPHHFLAMNPGLAEEEVEGYPTEEPAFGLQATWVAPDQRDRAERLGYTIVEPTAVLATHLTEIVMGYAPDLVTRQDVHNLMDNLKESSPQVVEELLPNVLTLGEIQKVLQGLLRERVAIRNLEVVLEVLADYGPRTRDPELLGEYCRHALARQICADYADEEGRVRVVTLAPALEQEVLNAVRQAESGAGLPMTPERSDEVARATAEAVQPLVLSGQEPIVLTSAQIRRFFRQIVERQLPRVVVLSYNEIDPSVKLESEGQVSI
ncbi:MAG: flagellar biosynthesis protein FlhA [bacterium]|nr:flagellar biosynthesis protein FlhA [bacterium]